MLCFSATFACQRLRAQKYYSQGYFDKEQPNLFDQISKHNPIVLAEGLDGDGQPVYCSRSPQQLVLLHTKIRYLQFRSDIVRDVFQNSPLQRDPNKQLHAIKIKWDSEHFHPRSSVNLRRHS